MNTQSVQAAQQMGISQEDYTMLLDKIRQDVLTNMPSIPLSKTPWAVAAKQLDSIFAELFTEGSNPTAERCKARATLHGVFRSRFKLRGVYAMTQPQVEEMFSVLPALLELMEVERSKAEWTINKYRKDGVR